MSFVEDGWETDFPRVMHFVDRENLYGCPSKLLKNAEQYPDYDAAKYHEDLNAAVRLIKQILDTPENTKQLIELKRLHPNSVLVPVHAKEAAGKNKIPVAIAAYIASKTGFEICDTIIQANSPHRTGAGEWHRLACRTEFDGAVQKNRKHILIDDVCTHGGTFSDLRYYIEKNGGQVIHTTVLALGSHGDRLSMPKWLQVHLKHLDKHDEYGLKFFCKEMELYEGNYKCLTKAEGLCIVAAKSLERARDKIFKARSEGQHRTSENLIQRRETAISTKTINSGIQR